MSDRFADRWVRIMGDYLADAVWSSDGASCSADELPISDALRAELRRWQAAYDDGWAETAEAPWGTWKSERHIRDFAARGLVLARRVKAELPDWTVVYHDEWALAQLPRNWRESDRITFEYPV